MRTAFSGASRIGGSGDVPPENSSKKKSEFYSGTVIVVPGIILGEMVSALASFRALVGGNSNNALHVGALALNVNNALSNANWNIGPA